MKLDEKLGHAIVDEVDLVIRHEELHDVCIGPSLGGAVSSREGWWGGRGTVGGGEVGSDWIGLDGKRVSDGISVGEGGIG